MSYWTDFGVWKERHCELVREAERGRLAWELREARGYGLRSDARRAPGGLWYAFRGWLRGFVALACGRERPSAVRFYEKRVGSTGRAPR